MHDVNNDVQEGTRGSVALNPPINGSRSTQNTFLLDGAYDTDRNTFAIAVYPPMESVQEFHIQSSLASGRVSTIGGRRDRRCHEIRNATTARQRVRVLAERVQRRAQLL